MKQAVEMASAGMINILRFKTIDIQNYEVYFGLYPSSGIYDKKFTTFRRLDLSPSSGGWGKVDLLSWAR
jgi:hypothetical protein